MPRKPFPRFERAPGSPKDYVYYTQPHVAAGRIDKPNDSREYLAMAGNKSQVCWSLREAKNFVKETVARRSA